MSPGCRVVLIAQFFKPKFIILNTTAGTKRLRRDIKVGYSPPKTISHIHSSQ